MPQTLYHASGLTADNTDKLKDAGMNVPGVKWVMRDDINQKKRAT